MWIFMLISGIIGGIVFLARRAKVQSVKGHLIPLLILLGGVGGAFAFLIVNKEKIILTGLILLIVAIVFSVAFLKSREEHDPKVKQAIDNSPLNKPISFYFRKILNYFRKKSKKTRTAKEKPLKRTEPYGVVFGKKGRKWVYKHEDTDGHILVTGSVGSGKTSCVAIPTLRAWNESVFAIDIKSELHTQSNDYRPIIKVFNPLDDNSCGYDPFHCLKKSDNKPQEARAIAQAIVPLPHDTREPFWIENAQNIFTGAILHYHEQGLSFLDTLRKIQSTSAKLLVDELCRSPQDEVRYCVNSLSGMEDKVIAGIMSEISKNIVPLITDKNLISALSKTRNITPDDLECGFDVYVQISEHLLRQWKNLLSLMVNQFLTHFEKRDETSAKPILFLLDEFPRLGKINSVLDGLATLRSKKITMCLIIQSLAQLDLIYGTNERKVICDTCAYKAILGASDVDTQDNFSKLVGTHEILETSHSKGVSGLNINETRTTQKVEKSVIKPHEFATLDDLVLLTPHGRERLRKMPYYLG